MVCKPTPENTPVWAIYSPICAGILCTLLSAFSFLQKWITLMNEEQRNSTVSRLSASVVSIVAMERIVRLFEFYLRFSSLKSDALILYHLNNSIFLIGCFGVSLFLLTLRLKSTFIDTNYAVPAHEIRTIYSLVLAFTIAGLALAGFLEGLNKNTTRLVILSFSALASAVCTLSVLYKIDKAFVTRLRTIVADQRARAIKSGERMPSDMHEFQMRELNSVDFEIVDVKPALVAKISHFEPIHRPLLRVASKSTTLTIWTTLSILLFGTSTIMYSVDPCYGVSTAVGQSCWSLASTVLSVTTLLSISQCSREYQYWCGPTNNFVSRAVALQTHKQVFRMVTKRGTNQLEVPQQ